MRCAGLSLSRPLLLQSTGSRRAGSVIVAHGPSRSAACGILPDQGSNPCPLHWQADFQPLYHQGSPKGQSCGTEPFTCGIRFYLRVDSVRIEFVGVGSLQTHTHAYTHAHTLELGSGTLSGSKGLNDAPQITKLVHGSAGTRYEPMSV